MFCNPAKISLAISRASNGIVKAPKPLTASLRSFILLAGVVVARMNARAAYAIIVAYIAASLLGFMWVMSIPFDTCAEIDATVPDDIKGAIEALEANIELGITLSTTLTGLGAALILGLKDGVRLTPSVRVLMLFATMSFCQAALYGVWWRFGLAELWVNKCPQEIISSRLQMRFEAHFDLFMIGLSFFLLLIIAATCRFSSTTQDVVVVDGVGK